jgi:uncharacterized membrane protein
MRTSPRLTLTLIALLLAAFAVRLIDIQLESLWFDEGWSAHAAATPTLRDAANADATNPPLYYVILRAAAHFGGDSPLALRLVSAFFGVLVIPVIYALARRLFDPRAGLFAAFLAAFSPLLWWASQEARMYTLLALLVALAALAWHALLRRSSRRMWLLLWGAQLALLYAHNTGPIVALWLNAVTLLAYRTTRRPDWRWWIAGQTGVALLWSPYFLSRFVGLVEANSAVTSAPLVSLSLLASVWTAFWAGNWSAAQQEPLLAAVLPQPPYLGLSGIALLIALIVIQWRNPWARWLVAHVLILIVGLLLGLGILGNELHGRYLTMIAPLLVIPIGAGLARLRAASMPALAFFGVLFALAAWYAHQPRHGHDDARGMVRYYADHLTAADTVLAWSYADRYDLAYYWPRLGVQARRITLPEGADYAEIEPLMPRSGDVALNIWYTQRADYRGMMSCLLGHGTRPEPETFTTYGMSTLIYHAPALMNPERTSFAADFGVSRIESAGAIAAFTPDQALCLPIDMILSRPVEADLKAALIARSPLGWEVARADAVFAQADQRTTSQLAPGERLTAYPLIRLPYGAPSGDYDLYLRVYDENNLSGYEVTAANGARGRDIRLGTWRASEGADWPATQRETDLPRRVDLPVSESLRLYAHNLVVDTVMNGETLHLALLWEGQGIIPSLTLAEAGGDWGVIFPAPDTEIDGVYLDWRELRIPPDAVSGEVELRLPDGTPIARWTVKPIPARYVAPDVDLPIDVEIPTVGRLIGASFTGAPTDESGFPITLVWQAEGATTANYTVFAQLLDSDGQLIAQSDSIPAGGERPTTGWRAGEYIIDPHTLIFNNAAQSGSAALIVGIYDAVTGQRVILADGRDYISFPTPIDLHIP